MIGTDDAKKKFDNYGAFTNNNNNNFPFQGSYNSAAQQGRSPQYHSQNSDFYEAFFNQINQQKRNNTWNPGGSDSKIYFNGVDITELFSSGGTSKSKYVQKVKVSLEDLYCGKSGLGLVLKDTIWNRYGAAFRGGVASRALFEAFFISLSTARIIPFPWPILVAFIIFHLRLPRPTKMSYTCNIQPGWKEGTKLTFEGVEAGFDVIFIIEEKEHEQYHRIGNDLHTVVVIDEIKRSNGCTIRLESLAGKSISICLEPEQIKKKGGTVKVEGMGWPCGKKSSCTAGDLIVAVKVVRKREKKLKTHFAHIGRTFSNKKIPHSL